MQLSGALFYSFAISRSLESASGSPGGRFGKSGMCCLQNEVKRYGLLWGLCFWRSLVGVLFHKLKSTVIEFRYEVYVKANFAVRGIPSIQATNPE